MTSTVPVISTPPNNLEGELYRWLSDVKTNLENITSVVDTGLTDEQILLLIDAGLQGGIGATGATGASGIDGEGIPQSSVLPASLTGLLAIPSRTFSILSWDSVPLSNDAQYTKIFRNTVDDVLTSVLIGSSRTLLYQDYTVTDGTYYYWIASQSRGSVDTPEGLEGAKNTDSPTIQTVIDSLITAENSDEYIAANAIGTDFLFASTLAALTANLGDVTAGTLRNTDGTFNIDLILKYIEIAGPAGRDNDDYIRIQNGLIQQYVWTGITHQLGASLSTTEQGVANNNETVYLSKYYRSQPSIDVTIREMQIYSAANSGQDQTLQISAENIQTQVNTTFTEESRTLTLTGSNIDTDTVIQKTAGGDSWNASAYSVESYLNGCSVKFKNSVGGQLMVGLNTDPTTDTSFNSIDFALFADGATFRVYENGTFKSAPTTFLSTDELEVYYDGFDVFYKKNGVVQYTSQTSSENLTLFLDSSFYHQGTIATEITFNQVLSAVYASESTILNFENTTISAGVIAKTSSAGWNSSAYTSDRFSSCVVKATVDSASKDFTIGLTSIPYPNASSFDNDIEYRWRLDYLGGLRIYLRGVQISVQGSYTTGTVLEIEVKDNTVFFKKDGVIVYSFYDNVVGTLYYLDCSLHTVGSQFSDVSFQEITEGIEQIDNVNLTNHENTTISGALYIITTTADTAEKTDGITEWKGQAVSTQSYDDGCVTRGVVGTLGFEFILGLNTDNLDIDNLNINHGLYLKADNNIAIFENGVDQGNVGTASVGTALEIEYEDDTVTYSISGNPVGTKVISVGQTFYLDSAFKEVGGEITGLVFNEIVRDEQILSGQWQFDAVARLVLSDDSESQSINDITGPSSSATLVSAVYISPDSSLTVNVSVDLTSVRSTSTAGTNYLREVDWGVYYRIKDSSDSWTFVDAGTTGIGATLDSVVDNQLVTFPSSGDWEIYIEGVYADAGGTFNTGGTTYEYAYDTKTNNSVTTVDTGYESHNDEYTETQNLSMDLPSYTPPAGWSLYDVDYTFTYSYFLKVYINFGGSSAKATIKRDGADIKFLSAPFSSQEYTEGDESLTTQYTDTKNTGASYDVSGGYAAYILLNDGKSQSKLKGIEYKADITIRRPVGSSTTAANTLKVNTLTYDLSGSSTLSEGLLAYKALL